MEKERRTRGRWIHNGIERERSGGGEIPNSGLEGLSMGRNRWRCPQPPKSNQQGGSRRATYRACGAGRSTASDAGHAATRSAHRRRRSSPPSPNGMRLALRRSIIVSARSTLLTRHGRADDPVHMAEVVYHAHSSIVLVFH